MNRNAELRPSWCVALARMCIATLARRSTRACAAMLRDSKTCARMLLRVRCDVRCDASRTRCRHRAQRNVQRCNSRTSIAVVTPDALRENAEGEPQIANARLSACEVTSESAAMRSSRRTCYDGRGVDCFGMTFIAVAIIEATSATLAGRMTVFVVFASSPKRSM
jgi:hypothetical protein